MPLLTQRLTAFGALLALSLIPVYALAHGDTDQESADATPAALETHISHYEQEISDLIATADAIAKDYNADQPVSDRTDALVDDWEHVDFHEALENHAITLYPPIWVALGRFKAAVIEDSANDDVEHSRQQLASALHEGIGALKFVAARASAETDSSEATDPTEGDESADQRSTVQIIRDNLDDVLSQYRDGNTDAAKKLLHQTYMQRFEGIEGDLIERDADLVTEMEKDFNATLPILMEDGAPAAKVSATITKMNTTLDRAQTLLDSADQDKSSVF